MVDFGIVVGKLMSPNNAERKQAEVAYNNQKTSQPMMVLRGLGKLVNGHSDVKVRAKNRSTDEQDRYRSEYNAVYATGYAQGVHAGTCGFSEKKDLQRDRSVSGESSVSSVTSGRVRKAGTLRCESQRECVVSLK